MFYISKDNFFKLLDRLKENYEVYVPAKKGDQRFYKKYEEQSPDIVIGEVRAFEPLKAFFSGAREIVAEGFKPESPRVSDRPFAIVGVKSCDLKGFKIHDEVFLNHDYKDPSYTRNRQENLVISADCTSSIQTCFCTALGLKPYPEENFDINLSEVKGGFVAVSGSKKGEDVLRKHSRYFQKTDNSFMKEKEKRRTAVCKEVEKNVKENSIPSEDLYKGVVEKSFESDIWSDEAKTCVECGACNTICPTCHCFLLYDEKNEEKMARLRIWDSCMIKDFARVAGGANPRPKLWMRLRNRFDKKFDFFPKTAGIYACTGCGRCVSACPAKIDIRKVLRRLVDNANK